MNNFSDADILSPQCRRDVGRKRIRKDVNRLTPEEKFRLNFALKAAMTRVRITQEFYNHLPFLVLIEILEKCLQIEKLLSPRIEPGLFDCK